jgi:hypothetical protein
MKNTIVILSLVVVLALTTSVGFAGASALMRVHIPFEFYAGDQQMPAGDYTVSMESSLFATGSQVRIHSQDGQRICFLLAHPGKDEAASQMSFNRYGNKHFLATVSIKGFRAALRATKLEHEIRAQLQTQQNVVTIAQK